MKKITLIVMTAMLIFALTACSTKMGEVVEGDGFSVGVPEEWEYVYSEFGNTVVISEDEEDPEKPQIIISLAETELTKEEVEDNFKSYGHEDLGTKTIGGVDFMSTGFSTGNIYAIWYGGVVIDNKEVSIQVINEEDKKYTEDILDTIEWE